MPELTIDQALQAAVKNHRSGNLAHAEQICRQILARQPNHPDALYLLGTIGLQVGQLDAGIALIRRAIAINPNFAPYHNNLGNGLCDKGLVDEALAAYREAIRLNPDFAQAWSNVGNVLIGRRMLEEAIAAHRRAVQLQPDYSDARNNLGVALAEAGQFESAIAEYREAIRLRPDYPEAHNNLGNALRKIGRADDAIASYRAALRLRPNYAEALSNLGSALCEKNEFGEAITSYREAIRLKPGNAETHSNFGNALRANGQLDDAIAAYRRAVQLKPDYAEGHANLGNALHDAGSFDEAVASFRQAIHLRPNYPEGHFGLGIALADIGDLDAAIASYRHAMRIKPDYGDAHLNLLLAMLYRWPTDPPAILSEHRAWSDAHAKPLEKEITAHANDRSPDRPLRIGYVSADFRRHPVGFFIAPLLEHHDRSNFHIACYFNSRNPDELTDRLKRHCDLWRDIADLSDQTVAAQIRADEIDILVDLSAHTRGNRLLVFARKPAPIQITYLAYPATTGLQTIDYRFTDALADPPGTTELLHTEKLLRLPVCNWCFAEPEDAPPVQTRDPNRPISFGSFNKFTKISPFTLDLWAKILQFVPNSRLILKDRGLSNPSHQQRIHQSFASRGVSPDRLGIRDHQPDFRAHLDTYNELDIALDTYPYHGTTTTCQALWMSIPVVTLAGSDHMSRVGVSLLTNIGLPDLIANSPAEYIRVAVDLANDLPRLSGLRQRIRRQMRNSPLMNAARFAADVERAYRQTWRDWCSNPLNSPAPRRI